MIKQPASLPLKGMIVFPNHHYSILILIWMKAKSWGMVKGNAHTEMHQELAKGHIDTSSLPPKIRRSLDVFEQFGMALSKMANHTGKLADAFQKEPVKSVLPAVMNALQAIPELTALERVCALHKMGAQPFLVDVFFAMDEENRFEWVKSDIL